MAIKAGLSSSEIFAQVVVHGTVVQESQKPRRRSPTIQGKVLGQYRRSLGTVQSWDSLGTVLGRCSLGTVQSWDGPGTARSWDSAVLGQYSLGTVVFGQWSWDSGLGTVVLGQRSLGQYILGQWSWDGTFFGKWSWDSAVLRQYSWESSLGTVVLGQ